MDTESLRKYVKEQTANRITLQQALEQDDTIPIDEKVKNFFRSSLFILT